MIFTQTYKCNQFLLLVFFFMYFCLKIFTTLTLKTYKMNKTTKIIIWSFVGLTVVGGAYYGYTLYKKAQTTSKDPEKNSRKINVTLNAGV